MNVDNSIWKVAGKIRKATQEEIETSTVIKVAGYEAKFKGSAKVSFGCQEFDYEDVRAVKTVLEKVSNHKNIELTIGGEKVTIDNLNRILEKIK